MSLYFKQTRHEYMRNLSSGPSAPCCPDGFLFMSNLTWSARALDESIKPELVISPIS